MNYKILALVLTFIASYKMIEKDNSISLEIVSFGTEVNENMDDYLPKIRNTIDTIMFMLIHGGAWCSGDKSEFELIKPILNSRIADYAFVSFNYLLFNCKESTNLFPIQENDVVLASNFINSKLTDWRISERIVIAGACNSAHLALLQTSKNKLDELVKSCIAYFPPSDLITLYTVSLYKSSVLFNDSPDDLSQAFYGSSPLNFVTDNSIPTMFFNGNVDRFFPIGQSELLQDCLRQFSEFQDIIFFEGEGLGFSSQTNLKLFIKI